MLFPHCRTASQQAGQGSLHTKAGRAGARVALPAVQDAGCAAFCRHTWKAATARVWSALVFDRRSCLQSFERERKELGVVLTPQLMQQVAALDRALAPPGGAVLMAGAAGEQGGALPVP